jgi:hypothetical protein
MGGKIPCMSATIQAELGRLSQEKLLAGFTRELRLLELITVYLRDGGKDHSRSHYCALVKSNQIEKSLGTLTWDLFYGNGIPGAVRYYKNGQTRVDYLRFGNDHGVEPLIIGREFHGIRPNYLEISEEFRLFHDLYHDRKDDRYYKVNDAGNEELVAIIEPNKIQIRLKEIRQFLAIKEMHLAIFFDSRVYSTYSLETLGLKEGGNDQRRGLTRWDLHYGEFRGGFDGHNVYSRLSGKRLIEPLPKEKSEFWGFAEKEQRKIVDFIIGIDRDGNEVLNNSDPDLLANNFGANRGAPHYLTPVHFRKEVLDKYYQKPGKYSVEDSILRCASLWSMTMDNHHDDRVVAWLGDLGRDLPYEEQLHWRSYNIPPSGGPSETFIRRQLLAQFAKSERPEHLFPQCYEKLQDVGKKFLGWQLLLPLSADDAHHFRAIRIPSTDEQKDFDDLVQSLTKVLIDSLNEKALNALIPPEQVTGIKGSIARLEAALTACNVIGFEPHVGFLRKLQKLRSSGAAHRKGGNYRKIADEFQVDSQNLRTVFAGILAKALEVLRFFISTVQNGSLVKTDAAPRSSESK